MPNVAEISPGRYVLCTDGLSFALRMAGDTSRGERLVSTCYPSALSEAEAEAVPVTPDGPGDLTIRLRRSRMRCSSGTSSGRMVRSTCARILRTADGTALATNEWREPFADIIEVQDRIAESVTSSLELALTPDERTQVRRQGT